MNNNSLQAIKDTLAKNEAIGIIVGKNPTLDSMGAALALYLSLQEEGRKVIVACPSEPLVEISSLVGINKVKQNFDGEGGDLIVSFPYREGEIEKVSYTLEEGFLNIVVKAGEKGLSFQERDIKYNREGSIPRVLFVIGTSRISDLGRLYDPNALKDATVINIDNKNDNQGFGDVVLVSPNFSSVSEQIFNLLNYLGSDINIDIAQNLLSGISFATDNFQSPKTSILAFETAAMLMKRGAVRKTAKAKAFLDEDPFTSLSSQGDFRQPVQPQVQSQVNRFRQKPSFKNASSFLRQQTQQSSQPQNNQGNLRPANRSNPIQDNKNNDDEAPSDWLTPKIYKGSTNI